MSTSTINIAKLKADLQLKASLDELEQSQKEVNKKIANALKDMPTAQMMDSAIYIRENLLPRLEKKGGKLTADYKFFEGVEGHLLKAISAVSNYEFLLKQYT